MLKPFVQWLKKPYPLIEHTRDKLLLVIGFALFTYIFLLLYQPFGAAEIKEGRNLFLAGFGVNVGIGLAINYFLLPALLPGLFQAESWQIGKEIIYLSWCFVLISIFNYLYNSIIGGQIAPQHSLLGFLGITFSIGVFPLLALIYLTESVLNKRNQARAQALRQEKNSISKDDDLLKTVITIQADTLKTEPLVLDLDDFLFARSDNNYVTIFYMEDQKLENQLLRISLKKVSDQLANYPIILRCHRSYLVNKKKISNIKGNARSLNLELLGFEGLIPVSRGFPKEDLL